MTKQSPHGGMGDAAGFKPGAAASRVSAASRVVSGSSPDGGTRKRELKRLGDEFTMQFQFERGELFFAAQKAGDEVCRFLFAICRDGGLDSPSLRRGTIEAIDNFIAVHSGQQ